MNSNIRILNILRAAVISLLWMSASACIPQSDKSRAAQDSALQVPKISKTSEGLVKLGPATGYNLEKVGETVQPSAGTVVVFPAAANLLVSGWAVDEQKKVSPGGVDVLIDGRHFPANFGIVRADVEAHFKNRGVPGAYLSSGFDCIIPGAQMGKGPHVLSVHVISGDGKGYYETVPVTIEGQ